MTPLRFRATVELGGKTATGIRVPDEVVTELASGKRPAVRVTVGAHTYRTTVAVLLPSSTVARNRRGVMPGERRRNPCA